MGNKIKTMYTIYDGGDTQILERPNGTKEQNEFVFNGFGNGIHPFHRKQLNWITELLGSAGVKLVIREVPTVHQMGKNIDNGEFELEDLKLRDGELSGEGFFLLQDVEMGRGWACLIETSNGKSRIVKQDHRDSVRDEMLSGQWLTEQGVHIQYKTLTTNED